MAKSQIVLRVLVIAIYNWYLCYQQFETTSDTHVAMEEMTDEQSKEHHVKAWGARLLSHHLTKKVMCVHGGLQDAICSYDASALLW